MSRNRPWAHTSGRWKSDSIRLKEVKHVTMVGGRRWKLVHYRQQDQGDLYDLIDDPGETRNLWHSPGHHRIREELAGVVLGWHS